MSTKPAKATFKRAEVFAIGKLVEERCTPPGPTRAYVTGQNDASVAAVASERFGRPISAQDVARIRHQVIGKLAGEGRPTPEIMENLTRAMSAQAVVIKQLTDRLDAVEREMKEWEAPPTQAPVTRTGNGYQPPRPR